jgi:SAM-dependent methyltransferase
MRQRATSLVDRELNYGRHILRDLTRNIHVARVLDVGGGLGADLATIRSQAPDAELHAIESNVHYANALRQTGIHVRHADLETTPLAYPDRFFDLIIANQILEHVKQLYWVFHEISRTLKIGGHLYVGVPNLASLHNRMLLLAGRQPTCIKSASAHVRGFTKRDLLNFISACWPGGFELVAFRGSNFYPFPRSVAKPLSRIFPSAAVSIFFLFRKAAYYGGQFVRFPEDLETNFFLGREVHHVVGS